mgnify:CR=1 FL=1
MRKVYMRRDYDYSKKADNLKEPQKVPGQI